MEKTLSTSPSVSQSSTPRPRSALGESLAVSRASPPLEPDLLSPQIPYVSSRSTFSLTFDNPTSTREQDPITALAGPSQPFFMSQPSHDFNPPPPTTASHRDDPVEAISSLWDTEQGAHEPWGRTGTSEGSTGLARGSPSTLGETHIYDLVASLEDKVSRLTITVRDMQHRLDYVEQAAFDRERQVDYLHRVTTMLTRQRPLDDFVHPRYFASHAGAYASTAEMTPPESIREYTLTPSSSSTSLPFVDLSPTHRRTISTPIRPNESTQARSLAYAVPSPEHPHGSLSSLNASHFRQATPVPSASTYMPELPTPFSLRRNLSGSFPRARPVPTSSHSRTTSASSSGGGAGSSGGLRSDEDRVSVGPPSTRSFREDGYNYRGLLECDSEIEEDIFVRRVFLQNDQQCSLFLQQRVKSTTSLERRQRLLESVGRHLLDLSASKFGNFLVSRCIESADQNVIQLYSARFVGHFLELSLDPFGCHVVQKLLDRCDSNTKERVIDELAPFPNTLLQKPSLHVWNRLLSQPNSSAFYARLANQVGAGSWRQIVLEEGGSLIVQHLLEDWSGGEVHASVVARELLDGLEQVAQTACGSFVLVAFVDRNFLPFRTRVMEIATQLSLDTFGAKLVERVIKLSKGGGGGGSNGDLLTKFIDEITAPQGNDQEPPLLLSIASHASGSSLLSYLVSSSIAPYPDKAKLVRCISINRTKLVEEGGVHAARLSGLVTAGGSKA